MRRLTEMAGHFSLTYIHAAWQMTLDGQRRILTSLEPAAGLELLLLNLALLPRLLPLAELNPAGTPPAESNGGPTPVAPSSSVASEDGAALSFPSVGSASSGVGGPSARRAEEATPRPAFVPPARREAPRRSGPPAQPASGGGTDEVPAYLLDDEVPLPEPDGPAAGDAVVAYLADIPAAGASGDGGPVAPGGRPSAPVSGRPGSASRRAAEGSAPRLSAAPTARGASSPVPPSPPATAAVDAEKAPLDPSLRWTDFLAFCEGRTEVPAPMLRQFEGSVRGDNLVLRARSQVMFNQMQRPPLSKGLEKLAAEWAGRVLSPVFLPPSQEHKTEAEWRTEMLEHPVVRTLQTLYDATLLRCSPVDENR